jgi:tetratricopeptide (TPR) repeat protein
MNIIRKVTSLSTYCIVILLSTPLFAHDDQYIAAMQKNIQALYEAKTIDEYQTSINAFERIAGVEKDKWEPIYYTAFGYALIAVRETAADQKDAKLDLALQSIKKATQLSPNESEIITLEGFIHMIRLSIDPASRGVQYAGLAMQYFQTALKINPENPRALSLLAQLQFGTAEFFGSSTSEACATANAALVKFDTFKSENPLAPQWGRSRTEKLIENCK